MFIFFLPGYAFLSFRGTVWCGEEATRKVEKWKGTGGEEQEEDIRGMRTALRGCSLRRNDIIMSGRE